MEKKKEVMRSNDCRVEITEEGFAMNLFESRMAGDSGSVDRTNASTVENHLNRRYATCSPYYRGLTDFSLVKDAGPFDRPPVNVNKLTLLKEKFSMWLSERQMGTNHESRLDTIDAARQSSGKEAYEFGSPNPPEILDRPQEMLRHVKDWLSNFGSFPSLRERFTGLDRKKDQPNHAGVPNVQINVDEPGEFSHQTSCSYQLWQDLTIEENGQCRIIRFLYKRPVFKPKVSEIIFGIAGQAAAGLAQNLLTSASNSSHPTFYVVVGAIAVAFVATLIALSVGDKRPILAGRLGKVGAAAATFATLVGLGMYLPDHQILISGIMSLITVLVLVFA